ncbi:MAG TPA: hypothetical protein DEB09_02750 [Candidatus Magasanikbacteria bacterium]|nr:hypothetical protein [Candidatus Magasanikbacteria bacterium]
MPFSFRTIFGSEKPSAEKSRYDNVRWPTCEDLKAEEPTKIVEAERPDKTVANATVPNANTKPDHYTVPDLPSTTQQPEKDSPPELKKRVTVSVENSVGLSVDIKITVIDPLLIILRKINAIPDANMIENLYVQAEKRALEGRDATTASKILINMIEAIAKKHSIDLKQFLL